MTGFRDNGEPAGSRPVSIRQPRAGYRYSVDSVLLAGFAATRCGATALDLGTGSGVLLLFLAAMCPGLRRGVGVEIQARLLAFARRNIAANGFGGRLEAIPGDFRSGMEALGGERFDLVLSNPPYLRAGEGRRSRHPGNDIARREVAGTMADLLRAAARHLAPRGRLALLFPPDRLPELLGGCAAAGIHPETLRFVHPRGGEPANVLLFSGRLRRPPRLTVLPPLVVHAPGGGCSDEVAAIYARLGMRPRAGTGDPPASV